MEVNNDTHSDRYKSYRIIDGKPKWVIVDENGNIVNKNPNKDELKCAIWNFKYNARDTCDICGNKLELGKARKKYDKEMKWYGWTCQNCYERKRLYGTYDYLPKKIYNEKNACDRCGKDFNQLEGWAHPYREYDDKGNWTGKWLCNKCFQKDEHKKRMLSDRRTGNLDPNSNVALGDNCEILTDKLFGTKRLSVEYDKYSQLPLDHFPIPNDISVMIGDKLVDLSSKVPLTKGRTYNPNGGQYSFGHLDRDYGKDFDIYIFYCISRDGKIIERIYIIPVDKFEETYGISIIKNPMCSRGTFSIVPWYEQYRITNENFIKKVNNIWKEITI